MDMFNKSLSSTGEVPVALKTIFKKPNLSAKDLANYRPVSNVPFISKLLEKVIAKRLSAYLVNKLLPCHQSACRRFHSTDTALLRVRSDLTSAVESGMLAFFTLLDMSAAFDTVDHETLLRRLDATYTVLDYALWGPGAKRFCRAVNYLFQQGE